MKTDYSGTAPQIPGVSTLSRRDLEIIADMIDQGSRVLDVGCGNGALLDYLGRNKGVDGRGIELSQAGVNACVAHGLSVIQGDADTDLEHYPDDAFDFVVLTRTLQATRNPREVVSHLVRIGRHAIVSFTNFGHWRVRIEMMFGGRMPVVGEDGASWYDTPNIHLCTIGDFSTLCDDLGLRVQRALSLSHSGSARELKSAGAAANIRGEEAIFVLTRE
ncbi:MAG TPA: methionine biosynthesis protein MetW [Rhodospirillaceae bacterium]|nr:methionine biosynthesis protein MetW [Rhodospirillaceae bacterium]|tara:strand:+ start:2289 stop:2942 length:654 start_codon:yes stop_codon:yes gene_type:complete